MISHRLAFLCKIHVQLLGMALLWGASWPMGRVLSLHLPPLTAASWRFLLAALLLFIWLFASKSSQIHTLSRRQWLGLTLAAASGIFAYAVCFMYGMKYLDASKAVVVISLNPALTLICAALCFKERLNLPIICGMLLALSGTLYAITQGQFSSLFAATSSGELIIFGCVLAWVGYTLIGRLILKGIPALTVTTLTTAIGAIMLTIAAAILEGGSAWQHISNQPQAVWLSLFGLAFGATTLAYAWYFDGVKAIGAGASAAYISLVPIFGIALSAWWLQEPLSLSLKYGAAAAIAGMLLMQYGQMRRQ